VDNEVQYSRLGLWEVLACVSIIGPVLVGVLEGIQAGVVGIVIGVTIGLLLATGYFYTFQKARKYLVKHIREDMELIKSIIVDALLIIGFFVWCSGSIFLAIQCVRFGLTFLK
jgi:hypothetical protein